MKTCRSGRHQYETGFGGCPECRHESRVRAYWANPEKFRAKARSWGAANPERLRERARLWRLANPEKVREHNRRWYSENPERVRALAHRWYFSNHSQARENNRRWKTQNPTAARELARTYGHRRRARQCGVDHEPVTRLHLRWLFEAQNGRCLYCRQPLGKDKHLDHRIPLARGGPHAPHNLAWSCPDCNLRKGKMTEMEFVRTA